VSLELSREYLDGYLAPYHGYTAPLYLAVQDGMTTDDLLPFIPKLAGLFVGGTLEWKVATGESWVAFAHAHGLLAHIGRCGATDRIGWAKRINADSIDSCVPLWSEENLARFVGAIDHPQLDLSLTP